MEPEISTNVGGVNPYWIIYILIGVITAVITAVVIYYRDYRRITNRNAIAVEEMVKAVGVLTQLVSTDMAELKHNLEMHKQESSLRLQDIKEKICK